MITCENCGTQILENSTACPACGAAVTPGAEHDADAHAAPETGAVTTPLTTADAATSTAATATAGAGRTVAGTSAGMSSKTKAIIAALVAIVASLGLIFWLAKAKSSHGLTTLTPEDMA